MKTTVTRSAFIDAFRQLRPYHFSRAGLDALFDYLEDYEESTGEEIELDVISLCCIYSEYNNLEEFQRDYSTDFATIDDIQGETVVILLDNGFIIQNF